MDKLTNRTDDVVTFTVAAEMLGVSRPTVYNLIERQKLHPFTFRQNRYLARSEVEWLLKERSRSTP